MSAPSLGHAVSLPTVIPGMGHCPGQEGTDLKVSLPDGLDCGFTVSQCVAVTTLTLCDFQYSFLSRALVLFLPGTKGRGRKENRIHLFIQQNRC